MKIGIIVHSITGNTLSVAEHIQQQLAEKGHTAVIERIRPSGKEPVQSEAAVQLTSMPDLSGYEALVFGSPVQAFSLGPHLGMQFHIEITPLKIESWLANPGEVYPDAVGAHPQTVQAPAAMRAATAAHQAASYRLADRIYGAWRRRWRTA